MSVHAAERIFRGRAGSSVRSPAWIAAGNLTGASSIAARSSALCKAQNAPNLPRPAYKIVVKKNILLAAILTAAMPTLTTFAYDLEPSLWTKNRTVLMHLSLVRNTGLLQDGFASFNESAEDALNIWNQHMVHLRFAANRGSVLPPNGNDADTSVLFSDTVYGDAFRPRVLAVTLLTDRNSTLLEADVIFNSAVNWNSYRGNLQSGSHDFHRVALHEFGHVLGLDHPDEANPSQSVVAIMNSTVTHIDSLQGDDIAGAQALHANGPNYLNSNPAPNLVNLSTRAFVGLGDNAVIGGFIIQGSQPATVVLRGIGNSLRARGIPAPLDDPVIELRNSGGGVVAESDDWIDSPDSIRIASYRLDPSNSREAAIYATLNPGSYTVVVRNYDNGNGQLTGTGVVELYDLHTTGGRAGNISTRGPVLTNDDVLIGGFIVGGTQPKRVIVRALGPSLANSSISNPLGNPTLELRNSAGSLIATNDDWQNGFDAAEIEAAGFAPSQPAESALRAILPPGSYTAIVRGVGNTTGIGLVEIYDLDPPPN